MILLKILCNGYKQTLFSKTSCFPQLRLFVTKSKEYPCLNKLLPRCQYVDCLKNEEYDVVVIGGGCVGAGCALDAATRGLKTALIERTDFASGTSCKSTKLVHGGVRYLQEAIMNCDFQQFQILAEALRERGQLLKMAPHLTKVLPILVPLRK